MHAYCMICKYILHCGRKGTIDTKKKLISLNKYVTKLSILHFLFLLRTVRMLGDNLVTFRHKFLTFREEMTKYFQMSVAEFHHVTNTIASTGTIVRVSALVPIE